jgi:Cu+-exporting ATPase
LAISALEAPVETVAATFCSRSLRAAGRWAAASAARDEVGRIPEVEDIANVVGLGVQGVLVDGERCHAVLVGRSRLLGVGAEAARGVDRAFGAAQVKGATAIAVGWHGQARGVLVVAEAINPTSTEAIASSASSV